MLSECARGLQGVSPERDLSMLRVCTECDLSCPEVGVILREYYDTGVGPEITSGFCLSHYGAKSSGEQR